MPEGMFLKSEGCASNLSGPGNGYSVGDYCASQGIQYAHLAFPVALDVFTAYALAFQQKFVPGIECERVHAVAKNSSRFDVTLQSGEVFQADKVIIATGLSGTAYVPPDLQQLPCDFLTHSSVHRHLSRFRGRDVTVIGAGQSALETAALLHEADAEVRVLVRGNLVRWNANPQVHTRPLYQRLRRPMSGLGPGYGPWLYCNAPALFRRLPEAVRLERVRNALGPAGAGWLRGRVEERLPVWTRCRVCKAEASNRRAVLHLEHASGRGTEPSQVSTDHVIAATGYRFRVSALPFLSAQLKSEIACGNDTPILSAYFESSVTGLYFTGLASANQFGPSMRFLLGTNYTARRIFQHITTDRSRSRQSVFCTG